MHIQFGRDLHLQRCPLLYPEVGTPQRRHRGESARFLVTFPHLLLEESKPLSVWPLLRDVSLCDKMGGKTWPVWLRWSQQHPYQTAFSSSQGADRCRGEWRGSSSMFLISLSLSNQYILKFHSLIHSLNGIQFPRSNHFFWVFHLFPVTPLCI